MSTRAAMMASFLEPCCQAAELAGKSLVNLLLELQTYLTPNKKSREWAANIKCLLVPQEFQPEEIMILESISETSTLFPQNYVAVSYSCERMPEYEKCDIEKHYKVQRPEGQSPNITRNIVIKRALRYANYVGSSHIWTDQDCINQEDEVEKQLAMDSMDLVYSESEFPVGLMATVLDTEDDIRLLWALLGGRLTSDDSADIFCDTQDTEQVMGLLERFADDRWWSRAWIFQEEYLAGTRMNVLIRHSPVLEEYKRQECTNEIADEEEEDVEDDEDVGDEDDHIEEEICFSAVDFRQETTLFLLALQRVSCMEEQQRIADLLKVFGKYNVLYHPTASANTKAMSCRIIAEIHKRGIGKEYDLLSIAANSCGHTNRFDANEMAKSPYSVNLCTLAIMLINGEIITNDDKNLPLPTEMGIGEYLDHISFDQFDPPVAARELSWLKNCRFPYPKLVPSGIRTEGYLWRVEMEVRTHTWGPPLRPHPWKSSAYGLKNRQRACLLQLLKNLRKRRHCGKLAKHLQEYLEQDLKLQRSPGEARKAAVKRYKDLMAHEVCNAIENCQTLYLAAIDGTSEIKAIFVGPGNRNASVFTAWSHGMDEDGRTQIRHLSLNVRIEKQVGRERIPRLKIQHWVNGLVFFTRDDQARVIVSWSETWLRTNPLLDEAAGAEVV